jgi:phosphoribosyl-ATP pyrophosphohydrolase
MAALVRHDTALEAVFPRADSEIRPGATEIACLYDTLYGVSERDNPRTARLLSCGRSKIAQKLIEEAGEIALEAVRHRSRAVVRESADLVYHLVVLWHECGITPRRGVGRDAPARRQAWHRRKTTQIAWSPVGGRVRPVREEAMSSVSEFVAPEPRSAVLDDAHIGHINGALGTILHGDIAPRAGWIPKLKTLLAILGPGLIVMVADNDAGAFGTYTQAGQNFGTTLLWTLALLVPVLYVNQEMVLRLGAVSGVGHARLILERFGKFWGAFSVIDLFLLNALTIVTEFIGISLALGFLGVSKPLGVIVAAVLIMVAAGTGNFLRFERFSLVLVVGSLLLVPVFLMVHPPVGQMLGDFLVPRLPQESFQGGRLGEVMLLIIAIVGTTVAPWQLFFQQSYVIDKRISPRFIPYERADLWIGIVFVTVGRCGADGDRRRDLCRPP